MKFNLSSVGWLIGLLLVSLSLAACGGSATPEAEVESAAPAEEATAATAAETEESASAETVTEATEEAAVQTPAEESSSNTAGPVTSQAACYPVDIPTNTLIAAVSDTDWSRGPADAPVTVIEYGDFQ
jgi:protein-disulfide isomerase